MSILARERILHFVDLLQMRLPLFRSAPLTAPHLPLPYPALPLPLADLLAKTEEALWGWVLWAQAW